MKKNKTVFALAGASFLILTFLAGFVVQAAEGTKAKGTTIS